MMQQMNRRGIVKLGLASVGALSMGLRPALAQDNPMPDELRQAIERQKFAPVLGNPDGNITLTEFFDYNCPYCRTTVPIIQKLIANDPQLRVVFREWPVLSEGSYQAAQVSLSALKQGKYWAFHSKLMAVRGRVMEASVLAVAREVGLDMARLETDMQSEDVLGHIDHSTELGDHMGLSGTPTFIAGNDGRFGGQSYQDLRDLVAKARKDLL